jgi:hypothetical protein
MPIMKICGKIWTARQATRHNIIGPKRFTCWITKAANTNSEHVMCIVILRQKLLLERPSMLRYTYIACLVF